MDWEDILIEVPARFVGHIAGELVHIAWVFAALAAAIYVGRFIYKNISVRYINVAASIVVGLYLALVLTRAESFFAAAIFNAIERGDED